MKSMLQREVVGSTGETTTALETTTSTESPAPTTEKEPPPPQEEENSASGRFTDLSDSLMGGRGAERERKQQERVCRVHQLLLICEEQRGRKDVIASEGKEYNELCTQKAELIGPKK
ncbi:hypothetical protein AGDE_15762 [Angomonas deanei]|uniref:Uncharacterized protein n=1 Tax=Angomonas deanei TaxID=59799 RepID=A0A7G2C2K1_9TRYP|nr:hypothetical protein AGDE_15762 [Angomonas deanei]CAD2213879.1 hypothetical protein, conserved [Angomonas deanei]|eukprot:EPY18522.1 hypothetical protein AGDE_15762 [Angomonas deanei]